MPVGKPIRVGRVRNINDFFGFVNVEVTAPNLNIPFLPCKFNDRLITPTGSWKGLYFSEEIKWCMSKGYNFQFFDGYKFDKGLIFNDYVQDLYEIKRNSSGVRKIISKLGLNALYGKKGSRPLEYNTVIGDSSIFTNSVLSSMKINEDLFLADVSISRSRGQISCISVPIASAIAAYSRMDINRYKCLEENLPVYTDTDSVI